MTIQIDNGAETVTIDANAPDARSIMLASANAIAQLSLEAESNIAESAKAWGTALFRAVHVDGLQMDALIGDTKIAAGWTTLATTADGKKTKGRFEVYFSNARLVNENWQRFSDAERADMLNGLSSIHYQAGKLRKAESDAKREAAKEAKRKEAEAAQAATPAPATDTETETVEVSGLLDAIRLLGDMVANATDAELLNAGDAFNAMAKVFDIRFTAAMEAETAPATGTNG